MLNGNRLHDSRIWIVILLVLSFASAQLACQTLTSRMSLPTSESKASPLVVDTPAPDETVTSPTQEPEPPTDPPQKEESAQPPAPQPSTMEGLACFGTSGRGITCLGENGWQTFTKDNSPLGSDDIQDIAVCPNNRLLIAHALGISAFDGEEWKEYEAGWGQFSPTAVACETESSFWVAHFKGASYFDGENWTNHSSGQLATGEAATDLTEDVVIAPDGAVWVVTASSIAMFDGSAWKVFQEGQGFDKQYFFTQAVLDSQGYPWVGHGSGVISYDGSTWTDHENMDLGSIESLTIDGQDRIWVGTISHGIFRFDSNDWAQYDLQGMELASNHIYSIVIDDNERMWLGTGWGLVVLDEDNRQVYRMDNSDLVDHDIRAIAVVGGGPALPASVGKPFGSLTGQLLDETRRPLAGAPVEICVEELGTMFFGNTPCSDQPLIYRVETDADGNFLFPELPAGYYVITVFTGDGWAQLTTEYIMVSGRVPIDAGENTDLGEIVLQPEN